MFEASVELLFRYIRFDHNIDSLQVFMLLVAFKRGLLSAVDYILDNAQQLGASSEPVHDLTGLMEECLKLVATPTEEVDRSIEPAAHESGCTDNSMEYSWFFRQHFHGPLLLWIIRHNRVRFAELLLEGTELEGRPPAKTTLERWLCPYCAAYEGRHTAIELLIQNGMDPNTMGETPEQEKLHMRLHIGEYNIYEPSHNSLIWLAMIESTESSTIALFRGGYRLANLPDPLSVIKLALTRQRLDTLECILRQRQEITREHPVELWG